MISSSATRLRVSVERSSENIDDMYSHDLQLYQNAPIGEIKLDELQEISKARLKVLALVERTHLRKLTLSVSQRRAILIKELRNEGLDEFAGLIDSPGCKSNTDVDTCLRRKDHISHFILRSAVAFNVLKKRWFFKQEARLFKWRFTSLDNEGIERFMRINNFHFTPISASEKENIREYLGISSSDIGNIDETYFYKVPFSYVTSLVKKRKVFIMEGEAFVPMEGMAFVFVQYFRNILASAFEDARESRANLYNDERFIRIFANLENSICTESTVSVHDVEVQQYISLNELDKLSETSYPLCMRVLHRALRKNHHLTHGGRVQYGLFLKGIGISLSDAMAFWKNEFTKIMDENAFNKEHSYQIRFAFGWEGSRRNYQPYTCLKIMESIVGPRDYHGCPFKHMLHDTLESELIGCGFNELERSTIMALSKDGRYSAACNKCYEIKHGYFNDTLFKHPNIYFNESVKHHAVYYSDDLDSEIGDAY